MNPTGCVTALGDGGEAFVVLLPDEEDHCRRRRHPEHPPLPHLLPPLATADPYKSRPRRKDRGAFVVLPEPPPPPPLPPAVSSSAQPTGCSGRVSPFRGHGFRTPENGRSRASSPSSEPLRRQSSEPRIATGRRRPPATKQRLSVSTKDLSAAGKTATAGKPPSVPSTKSSPRKKPGQSGPPTPRKLPPKSPLPLRSPKTPRRSQPTTAVRPAVAAKPTVPAAKPTVAAKPMTGANRTGAPRPAVAAKSSPRTSKKHSVATLPSDKADKAPPTKTTANKHGDVHVTVTAAAAAAAATTTAPSHSSYTSSTTVGPTVTANAATALRTPTSTVPAVMPITASTSATAIATTHATNAIASAVVDGGPIVTAVPPPAAIAANTLATLSVAGPAAIAAKPPPPSAARPREPLATAAAAAKQNASTVVVVDRGTIADPVTAQRSGDKITTTTPPLSYELQEIVVEPEMENQSGRTAARLSVAGSGADGNKTSSTTTTTSSNGHKTVAWARQSEKIIVPAEVSNRAAETAASTTKDPAYKRFARKLCGGGGGGRSRPTRASSVAAGDGRTPKCWTAVWKRRPRWCGRPRCCGRERKDAARPAAAAAAVAGNRRPQWWRRCKPCWCCGKRKKRLGASTVSSSDSVGVLGISPPPPPSADTFCGKFKRRLCCCCGCCVVPKLFRRLCCGCCPRCGGPGKQPDVPKSKSADKQRPSLFKCTGCCTNIPKLDAVFVDHSSVMKGAIPVLPVTLAWLCLVFNVIIPGAGTLSSGMLCLCVGKPRFTVNDNFQSRVGAFCVNFIVAAAQLFTVLFCLVGWGWSIWWGVIMLKMAKKYQKVKVIDHQIEAPITVDHNHQI